MPTAYDVPADRLIGKLAQYLKENTNITPPQWSVFAKTGAHAERAPENPDWWYIRSASLLRKIYVSGPIGVERLRSEYGGRRKSGISPDHARKGGGSVIREAIQQLEQIGYIARHDKKGRVLTKEGRGLVDKIAGEIKKDLEREVPALKKY